MKTCSQCKTEKESVSFYKRKDSKDGLCGICKACLSLSHKTYRTENKETVVAKQEAWRQANRDRFLANLKTRRTKYPNENKLWHTNNPDKANAKQAKRRTSKMYRTPSWLTKTQLFEIKEFYSMAKELETVFSWKQHVDHIVPLQGKTVSGLHVPWNLQILPAFLNSSKGNRL